MPRVTELLHRKGTDVTTIEPSARVIDAATLMNRRRIGALVVVEAGRVVGMFTERDVLRRVVAERLDPAAISVSEVMTRDVVSCIADDGMDHARKLFMQQRVRHLPVLDERGHLAGLISIGDLNAWDLTGTRVHVQALEEYLYGAA
ncbi:MAG: CBS domain-containing protein [Planctomycetota bacterium]